jgi:replication fork protection complex subunit Csm3/Swi3
MYQLWLDDLYPRAKFADGLTIIEKLGHSKRIQMMRKAWIDEEKPKPTIDISLDGSPERVLTDDHIDLTKSQERQDTSTNQEAPLTTADEARVGQAGFEPEDDELEQLLAEQDAAEVSGHTKENPRTAPYSSLSNARTPVSIEEDEFADEMEAMAGMEDPW